MAQQQSENDGCGSSLVAMIFVVLYVIECFSRHSVENFFREYLEQPLAFYVCIPIIKAIIAGGIVWGASLALVHFIGSLRLFFRRPSRQWKANLSQIKAEEPSREQYLYWKGDWLVNTWAVCKENVKVNWQCMRHYLILTGRHWSGPLNGCAGFIFFVPRFFLYFLPIATYHLGRGLMLFIGIILLLPPLLVLALFIGFTAALISNSLAMTLATLEWLVASIRGVSVLCPECSHKVRRPFYLCPNCGKAHGALAPSPRYGIFFHRCMCGKLLPTSRLLGRARLVACCPNCKAPFATGAENAIPLTLAFIGASGSGKSYLEAAIINSLFKHPNSFHVKATFSRNAEAGKQLLSTWSDKGAMTAANANNATLLGVDISKLLALAPRRVYFHVPVGSSFDSMRALAMQSYYKHLACAVFVINPFTIRSVAAALRHRGFQIPPKQFEAASADDVFARWMIAINEFHQNALRKSACALVITHMDNPYIQAVTGLHPAASHDDCVRFLEDNGLHSLLQQMDEFKTFRLFTVSSQPMANNETDFSPGKPRATHESVEKLTDWVLDTAVF